MPAREDRSTSDAVYQNSLKNVEGKAPLGEVSLVVENLSKIVFHHTGYTSKDIWGDREGGVEAKVSCASAAEPLSLSHVFLYAPNHDGTVPNKATSGEGKNEGDRLAIRVGQAKYMVPISKISKMVIRAEGKKDAPDRYSLDLTMKDGQKAQGELQSNEAGRQAFLGGFTSEGLFFYAGLTELSSLDLP